MKVLLNCRETIDFIDRYLVRELTPAEERKFRLHLLLCRSCRAFLQTYRKTMRLVIGTRESPQPIPEELVAAILGAHH